MPKSLTEGLETEAFKLAVSPSHLLHRAEQLAAVRFTQLVGSSVTLRQFAVLAAIAESPGLSQAELSAATGVDRSTLADMMSRMQKRGWITRTTSPKDARAHSVRLAASGVTILAAATQHARAADAAVLDLLPRAKRRSFLNTLTKLLRLADEAAAREAKRQAKRDARARARPRKRRARRGAARRDRA
ncbi:MAG: MarR family winged helix-turn-helix transcriptional regulator [Hyphomonadaceae bacterium]